MTDEKFESRMNFILEQQAQFTVDIQALKESQIRTDGMLRKLIEVNLDLANHIQGTDERVRELDERVEKRDSVWDERMREWHERMKEMRESQAHSDKRLDALIDIVNQQLRRDNGGRKQTDQP